MRSEADVSYRIERLVTTPILSILFRYFLRPLVEGYIPERPLVNQQGEANPEAAALWYSD